MPHSNQTNYEPQVDDYVIWTTELGMVHEGWVYFKGDSVDNELRIKQGWNPVARYITIETGVRPKPQCDYSKNDPHKYIHTLLLCYESSWHELKFIKRRKSQFDDTIILESENINNTYKSQKYRDQDLY